MFKKIFKKIYMFIMFINKHGGTLFLFSIFYILLYQIKVIRRAIKGIFVYLNNILNFFLHLQIDLEVVKGVYHKGEYILIGCMICYILFCVIQKMIFFIRDKIGKKEAVNNFENSLLRYLNDNNSRRCYLVTGLWGTGKTYDVNAFFNKFYKYSNIKVYRVSCFGLNNRKALLEEINRIIENEDNSLYNSVIKIISYIPIIGKAFYGLLHRTYDLKNIKKNSIFIFDDFERITSKGVLGYRKDGQIYRGSGILRTFVGGSNQTEFTQIDNELKRINEEFENIYKNESAYLDQMYMEKYNAIIGLINELVETNKMKVLIICNADILGYEYVNNIFRGKLDCITYNKISNYYSIVDIINKALNSKIFNDDNIKRILKNFMGNITNDFENVWKIYDNKNLRLVNTFIDAFIETAMFFSLDEIKEEEFLVSLFYCIYIVQISMVENYLGYLAEFPVGGSVLLYGRTCQMPMVIWQSIIKSKFINKIKWIDLSISGFWLLNMTVPNDVRKSFIEYKEYKYSKVEEILISEDLNQLNQLSPLELKLDHVLYIQSENSEKNKSYHDYLEKVIFPREDSLDPVKNIEKILCKIRRMFSGHIDQQFLEKFIALLYDKYKVKKIDGTYGFEYNSRVQDIINGEHSEKN